MPSTRDIRRRIKSIKNTSQITKAMQMIAATKMRKAQQAALAGRPYAELMNHIMKSAEQRVNLDANPLIEKRDVKTVGVLLISTDKGLCGGLNTNLLRLASKYDPATTSFVTIGRKGRAFVARTKRNLLADYEMRDAFTFADARSSAKFVMNLYTEKKVDRVDVLYTNFVNTLTQRPEAAQLLPVSPGSVAAVGLEDSHATGATEAPKETGDLADYEYEPDANEVLGRPASIARAWSPCRMPPRTRSNWSRI
jgi:F-type H+-transporting ATPase subunit gamma